MRTSLLFGLLIAAGNALAGTPSCIIEKWETVAQVSSPNSMTVREFKRMTILNENGYSHAFYQDYYNSFRKIKSISYTIYDKQMKKVRRLNKSDAVDVMLNSSYETTDARIIALDPLYRNFPFTIELEVEISYSGFIDFPTWIPRSSHAVEVKEASLKLECPENYKLRHREINGIDKPVILNTENAITYTWRVANLPSVDKHLSKGSFISDQPSVFIAPMKFSLDKVDGSLESWETFGDWFIKLNQDRNGLSFETRKMLDSLRLRHHKDVKAMSAAIYRYMQSRTRYVSIQLGIGGYQAIPSEVVDKDGYGDCKALTNYMKSMLEYVGVPSTYILVMAGSDAPDILHDFPSNQFNHLFLAVPDASDTLWYECTSQILPPAHIGNFTDDRYVLWVNKGASRIIRTPAIPASKSVRLTGSIATIHENGDITLKQQITETGMFADELMVYESLPQDRLKNYNYARFHFRDFSILSARHEIPDRRRAELKLDFTLDIHGYTQLLGSRIVIPLNIVTPVETEIEIDFLNKKSEVRRGFTLEDKLAINVPEGYHIQATPGVISEKWDWGSIEITIEVNEDNQLIVSRKAAIQKGSYSGEMFEKFSQMIKKMRSLEQTRFVASKRT